MIHDVKDRKLDAVVVWALDRLTRDVVDMWDLINTFSKYNVKFLSMSDSTSTTTASGRLELNVKGIFAQYERERIGERVVEGMLERAKKGYYTANRVLGYDYDKVTKMFSINEDEAKIVRLIFELHNKGYGCVKIARHLNESNYKTKDGNTFSNNSINYMLNHSWYYCGKFMYRAKGKEPILLDAINIPNPIFTEEEYMTFRKVKNANYSTLRKYGTDEYIFKFRLYCTCGSPFKTYTTSKGDKRYRYYKCRKNEEGRCTNALAKRNEKIDEDFLKFLNDFSKEELSISLERNVEQISKLDNELSKHQSNLEKEINRKKRLQLMLLDETISKEDYESLSADIENNIKLVNENIVNTTEEIEQYHQMNMIEKEKELANTLANIWEDLSTEEKRSLIFRFIKKIVYSDKIERVEFII